MAHVARPEISQSPPPSPAAAGGLMCEEHKMNARNGEIASSTFPSIFWNFLIRRDCAFMTLTRWRVFKIFSKYHEITSHLYTILLIFHQIFVQKINFVRWIVLLEFFIDSLRTKSKMTVSGDVIAWRFLFFDFRHYFLKKWIRSLGMLYFLAPDAISRVTKYRNSYFLRK